MERLKAGTEMTVDQEHKASENVQGMEECLFLGTERKNSVQVGLQEGRKWIGREEWREGGWEGRKKEEGRKDGRTEGRKGIALTCWL